MEIAAALERAGVDGRRRAETLTLSEWAALTHALLMSASADAKKTPLI
jgi:hypothetical protein